MTHILVHSLVNTGISQHMNPEDKWDNDNTWTEHTIQHVSPVEERNYHDLTVDFELNSTDVYHLVWVIYATGDSFHNSEGEIEYIGLYKDVEVARENVRRIAKHADLQQKLDCYGCTKAERLALMQTYPQHNQHSILLVTEDGQEYKVGIPWTGYFDKFTNVVSQPVMADVS